MSQNDKPYIQPPVFNPQAPAAPMPNYQYPQYEQQAPPIPPQAPQQTRAAPAGYLPKSMAALEVAKKETTFKFSLIGSIVAVLVAPAVYIFNSAAGIGVSLVFIGGFMFLLFKVNTHIKYLTVTYNLDPRDIKPGL